MRKPGLPGKEGKENPGRRGKDYKRGKLKIKKEPLKKTPRSKVMKAWGAISGVQTEKDGVINREVRTVPENKMGSNWRGSDCQEVGIGGCRQW